MIWNFNNTGFNSGQYNMDYDMELVKNCKPDEGYFRLYRWKPYCISLGANQKEDSIDAEKAKKDGIDLVRRPTGGRAILHSEEQTYSVIISLSCGLTAVQIYEKINYALLNGLRKYNPKFNGAELEKKQPDFHTFYKQEKSVVCFANSAKSEIKYDGKKLVGSAQRKLDKVVLQHGSILCGSHHKTISEYLNLSEKNKEFLYEELNKGTIEVDNIINGKTDYDALGEAIMQGFKEFWDINN